MSGETSHTAATASPPERWHWFVRAPWEHLILWGLLLLALCLLRHLLLVMFLTFMLCYVIRGTIDAIARQLWRGQERPWAERILSIAMFGLLFVGAWTAARWLGPLAMNEGRELIVRLSKVDPDSEFHQLLSRTVGAYLFRENYGSPDSRPYQKAFGDYVEQQRHGLAAYNDFPTIEATVQRTVAAKVEAAETARLAAELARQPVPAKQFERWLVEQQVDPQAVASDPARLASLRRQWKSDLVAQRLAAARQSARYEAQVKSLYEQQRQKNAQTLPYDFPQFRQLQTAYAQGEEAFIAALGKIHADGAAPSEAELRASFEQSEQRTMAEKWWAESNVALLIRHHTEAELDSIAGNLGERAASFVRGLFSLPGQIATVLLLSFFITVDYPGLRAGVRRLKTSRLHYLYDEFAPGIEQLGSLVGRAFAAQSLVSLINAVLTYLALWALGVENALLLSVVVFIFSFVPVMGVILSAIPIGLMALVQPDGSFSLAMYAIGAVLVIHLIEAMIVSPKIVGNMLHLHPVLGIVVLAIADSFFGIWGLLLAYPVTVYLISRVVDAPAEHPISVTSSTKEIAHE